MERNIKGLPGLNYISDEERNKFLLDNAEKLKAFRRPGDRKKAAEILYNNQKFIDTFGEDEFNRMNDGTEEAYNLRNRVLKDKLINDAFSDSFSPIDKKTGKRNNKKGLGKDWEKYSAMSTDAKEKLLNSDWKTSEEMDKEWGKRNSWYEKAIDFVAGEPIRQYKKDSNQKILDSIYNDDADNMASSQKELIQSAYANPDIVGRTDRETKEKFKREITPGSYDGNMGISEYASHYGDGSDGEVSPEMDDMTIDEMRQILAKKAAYEYSLSPELANTALNNEAKRYIKAHQSSLRRFGLFAKDVGISAMSYTADKINGINNLILMAEDKAKGLPIVYVDDEGNILDPNKQKITSDKQGRLSYKDSEGNVHSVSKQQVARTTLHNMGKNEDGSDDESILNPLYWTRAEQFGTLDEDEQKQYEKLGSSPYKVAYDPNEDTDLVYESFKMMSFGIADAASMLLPFGVGLAGRTLSAASKAGKAGQALGKAMNYIGRGLSAETKFGQVSQGLVGAGGIAYAYQRGSFQETLAKNLAAAEEAMIDASKHDVFDRYQNDKEYKAQVDSMINARAAEMKQDYMRQLQANENSRVVDEKALDEYIKVQAQQEVTNKLLQDRIAERKQSPEYAELQNKAIDEAGNTATATFLPEAIKYGLVNTVGFRNFLYKHPTSLAKKAAKNFKGIAETTAEDGAKRLTVPTKFATFKDKAKALGKITASQLWGGAWTNGTDDMQVDAAERINDDKFDRYLKSYANDEAIADTYGVVDWIYAYAQGLHNSLGQNTTWDAALIGGAGSIVSASPHMANIAHLATKEGREAFKNNFQQRIARDENGLIKKDENGKPIIEDINWTENLGERAAFFIQNGVLNEYYGKQQGERNLQQHADYINSILDKYEDFQDLEGLVASDLAYQNAEDVNDKKTANFYHALELVNVLNHLQQNEEEPGLLSSTIQENLELIDKASQMTFENGEVQHDFTDEQLQQLLSIYSSQHNNVPAEDNMVNALQDIHKNAQKFVEASKAYDKAMEQVVKIEQDNGMAINPLVGKRIVELQALNNHFKDRINTMQEEIGDVSNIDSEVSEDMIIPVVGGRRNAEKLITIYDRQKAEINEEIEKQKKETEEEKIELDEAKTIYKEAKGSNEKYEAQLDLERKQAAYDSSRLQEEHLAEIVSRTEAKQKKLSDALKSMGEGTPDRVLTADEIFALDPVSRARMMDEMHKYDYSKKQLAEIQKLEQKLREQDAGNIQKIQDIAKLIQRVKTNSEAYNRMAKNPEAAAFALEEERDNAARTASELFIERYAQGLAEGIDIVGSNTKLRKNASKEKRAEFVYKNLKSISSEKNDILGYIDKHNLLPEYKEQIEQAKEWGKVVGDISSVISEKFKGDKTSIDELNAVVGIVETKVDDRKQLIEGLERSIDNLTNPELANKVNSLLQGLEDLGYQRDKEIIENRKQRLEREEAARKANEEAERRAQEAVKAAEEAAESKRKMAEEQGVIAEGVKQNDASDVTFGDETVAEKPSEEKQEETFKDDNQSKSLVNLFMDDDTEPGSITVGNMWTSDATPQRGLMQVNKESDAKGTRITFINDSKPEMLTVSPEDYRITKSQQIEQIGDLTVSEFHKLEDSLPSYIVDSVRQLSDNNRFNEKSLNEWVDLYVKRAEEKGDNVSKSDITSYLEYAGKYKQFKTDGNGTSEQINKDFNVKSIEKKDDGWYFNGTFAGETEVRSLPVSDNFDLESAIERQRTQREEVATAKGVAASDTIIDTRGGEAAVSKSLEEQVRELHQEDKITSEIDDAIEANANGDMIIDSNKLTNSGNAMFEWDSELLEEKGILKRREEKNTIESKKGLKHYQDWMDHFKDANGVIGTNIQNIIDTELGEIVRRKARRIGSDGIGETLKIHFACVNPAPNNITNAHLVNSRLFLAIKYDADAQDVHDINNGGVIESNGEKYLLVGVAGYGSTDAEKVSKDQLEINKARRDLYNNVFGKGRVQGFLNRDISEYFAEHPTDIFRVLDDITTEIVPGTLIPGFLVKQLEGDEAPVFRTLDELLNSEGSEKRNPKGWSLGNLKFGIQEYTTFYSPNVAKEDVMVPRNAPKNAGNTYILIPASNGKWLPVAINAYRYSDLVNRYEGKEKPAIYKKVEDSLLKLTSSDYEVQKNGILELNKIFHFSSDSVVIVCKKNGTIEFIEHKDGKDIPHKIVDLKASGDHLAEVTEGIASLDPRVNITASILRDTNRLRELDEIGALRTDCALLHTAGSRYSIYAIDYNGKMITSPGMTVKVSSAMGDSDYRNTRESIIYYNAKMYRYNTSSKTYTLDGETSPVTDESLIRDLEYNREVVERGMSANLKVGAIEYFILSSGENPKVISIDSVTKKVKELSTEESKKFIEDLKKKEEAKKRDEEAKKRNKESQPKETMLDEDVNDDTNNPDIETSSEDISSEINWEDEQSDTPKKEKKGVETTTKPKKTTREDVLKGSLEAEPKRGTTNGTVDFKGMLKLHKSKKMDIMKAIANKQGSPVTINANGIPLYNIDAVIEYLKSINMPVEGIGTSEADIQTWLDTLAKCR